MLQNYKGLSLSEQKDDKVKEAIEQGETHPVFHAGELLVQKRSHVESMAASIQHMVRTEIRADIPELCRSQSTVILSSSDQSGRVWANVLYGPAGFLHVVSPLEIRVSASVAEELPLYQSVTVKGSSVGLIVFDLRVRRRYRINGVVGEMYSAKKPSFSVRVKQAYGNCPKYIQKREVRYTDSFNLVSPLIDQFSSLSDDHVAMLSRADTSFVGTIHRERGMDISHRGGNPGFVRVRSPTEVYWPDYDGNNLFQTMGNIVNDPRTGLTVLDFDSGAMLLLSGRAEVVMTEDLQHPEEWELDGSTRLTLLHITSIRTVQWREKTPFADVLSVDFSPHNPHTGHREELKFIGAFPQGDDVTSFLFESQVNHEYRAGQYGIFQIIDTSTGKMTQRSWTITSLSSAYGGEKNHIEVSVKRVSDGAASRLLHDRIHDLHDGSLVMCLVGIEGSFTLENVPETAPLDRILFLSAGVGITPLITMLRSMRAETQKAPASAMDAVFIHSTKHCNDVSFLSELEGPQEQAEVGEEKMTLRFRSHVFYSRGQKSEHVGKQLKKIEKVTVSPQFHASRLTLAALRQVVPDIEQRCIFICGPLSFMHSITSFLSELGVSPDRIFSEDFSY